jgi:pimeloyl-ACP methyl ester carboxylesterase
VLLLLADGTRLPVTELPGEGPWTFLVLEPDPVTGDQGPDVGDPRPGVGDPTPRAPGPSAGPGSFKPAASRPAPEPGAAARFLTRYGRVVVPDLRGRPGFGAPPGGPGFLGLVDDLDQVRTRAGLGRPVLVGLGELAALALRAGVDQPWAWRALVLAPAPGRPPAPAELAGLDLPTLLLGDAGSDPLPEGVEVGGVDVLGGGERPDEGRLATALERLLDRLGPGPGWAGIAPDAPPR